MPYDPRAVSHDGHARIDEGFSRGAPIGQFRVIGLDTFDGTDWSAPSRSNSTRCRAAPVASFAASSSPPATRAPTAVFT